MKFVMTVKEPTTGKQWEEGGLDAPTLDDALAFAKSIIDMFNRGLRVGESPRVLVQVEEDTSEVIELPDEELASIDASLVPASNARELVVAPADPTGRFIHGYVVKEKIGTNWVTLSRVFAIEAEAQAWLDNELLPKSIVPAKTGDPDFLPPQIGGCWYCNSKEPFADMAFDSEFDTNVHRGCIKAALEQDPEHPEARCQKYLLEPEFAGYTGIEPTDLLDKEIAFAKGMGMPQFVMGLLQAKKVLVDFIDNKGDRTNDTE
jgi:hypothetical protein